MSILANNALLGVGLGLRFGLENKERSKEDQRHYIKSLMANLDITLQVQRHCHTIYCMAMQNMIIIIDLDCNCQQ